MCMILSLLESELSNERLFPSERGAEKANVTSLLTFPKFLIPVDADGV